MMSYATELFQKQTRLTELLLPFGTPEIQVFPSPEQHYRMRAEFRIWHEGENIHYAMFKEGSKASSQSLIRLTQLPIAHQNINQLMPILLANISGCPTLKQRLYQCEFLTTQSGETLVTLIYHRKLDEAWQEAARQLQNKLNIFIIGRSKGQKIVLQQDFVTEKLTVFGKTYVYRQMEGGFTQPNAIVCEKMLEWASQEASKGDSSRDLLELYCGNANFTLPLSQHFRRVLATEISKTSVAAAQWNIANNAIHNINIARLSAQEFTEAFSGSREFQRLNNQHILLKDYDFSTIFIDPPRAGVDEESLKLIAQFDQIIYVSCNPITLAQNLTVLTQTHQIESAALFDQFPFTHHIESGVVLNRKKSFQAA